MTLAVRIADKRIAKPTETNTKFLEDFGISSVLSSRTKQIWITAWTRSSKIKRKKHMTASVTAAPCKLSVENLSVDCKNRVESTKSIPRKSECKYCVKSSL